MAHQRTPTGETHEVGITDVFFSATDRRGVLEHANELFVRFSRYDRSALLGAPHSLVRHPDVPGAVFHTMWRELRAGRPFAGHLTNLAADGSAYSVYATVTPLRGGGYLSVRIRPMNESRLAQTRSWYRDLTAYESGLRAAGVSKRDAAAQGAERFERIVTDTGYASLTAFQHHALPQEIDRYERRADPVPARPGARGEVADLLRIVVEIDGALSAWSLRQRRLAVLSESLQRAGDHLQRELDAAARTVTRVTELSGRNRDPKFFEPLGVWAQMQSLIRGYIVKLIGDLTRLDTHSAENRFRIALAKLHTRMMAAFAAELIDAPQRDETQAAAIALLAESLRSALAEMGTNSIAHRSITSTTVGAIAKSAAVIEIPRKLLSEWQQQLADTELSPELRELADDVAASVAALAESLTELRGIVKLCGEIGDGDDPAELIALIGRMDAVTGQRTEHAPRRGA
ncbi:histidine kinase [Leucobacter luti]|uniref:Aerotaxis receptor n=1 Tax=Leucobacter luti TaxID=340320 RepID=A0A4Q7TU10_9MICO|nr:histidine kinase [Leucobacter luti]MBL3698460.1 histidine kinase [Leucobacter luti]RZT64451.1 aerotaxis receptor [Leucobacter luti]